MTTRESVTISRRAASEALIALADRVRHCEVCAGAAKGRGDTWIARFWTNRAAGARTAREEIHAALHGPDAEATPTPPSRADEAAETQERR